MIFIWIRYLVHFQPLFISERQICWDETTMLQFMASLKTINNRCGNIGDPSVKMAEKPCSDFRGQHGQGCVVLLLDTKHLEGDYTKQDTAQRIYRQELHFPLQDSWAETEEIEVLVKKQADNRRDKAGFVINQWLLTPKGPTSVLGGTGIELNSIYVSNPELYWAGYHNMTPEIFPNVIMQDYIGLSSRTSTTLSILEQNSRRLLSI